MGNFFLEKITTTAYCRPTGWRLAKNIRQLADIFFTFGPPSGFVLSRILRAPMPCTRDIYELSAKVFNKSEEKWRKVERSGENVCTLAF